MYSSLPGPRSLGDEMQPHSAGAHSSLPDPQPLPETEDKPSRLKALLFLHPVRTHEEESCIPSEVLTDIQGPQPSKVLSSLTHPFIYAFTQQMQYLLRPAAHQALLCSQQRSNNRCVSACSDLTVGRARQFPAGLEKGPWRPPTHQGLHHLLATLGKFLKFSLPQSYHL